MIKIAHVRELKATDLPPEVTQVVRNAVTILDLEYGEYRDVDSSYGGYVLVLESKGELGQLKEIGIDMKSDVSEYGSVGTYILLLLYKNHKSKYCCEANFPSPCFLVPDIQKSSLLAKPVNNIAGLIFFCYFLV